jgi:KDO2-lipid IV(A) lauroyltransferase
MPKESLLRDILRIIVWYPVRWLVLMLPIRWAIFVLRLMGDIHYMLFRQNRSVLKQNLLGIRQPEAFQRNVVREFFRNYYIDRLFIFIFPKFDRRAVEQFLEIKGLDNLNEALKPGKGAVLVHGHFGPVHLPLVALARLGYELKQIGNPSDEGLSWIGRHVAFRLRMIYERKIPAEIIKADSFLRPSFHWLSKNGIIMITGDGTGTDRRFGKYAPFLFLNREIEFPLGPALLSDKTGAALLPMFILPSENKLYKIIIEPSFLSVKKNDEMIRDLTGQFVKRFEHYVSVCPAYMHFLDRI